jgi:hypothetical protein
MNDLREIFLFLISRTFSSSTMMGGGIVEATSALDVKYRELDGQLRAPAAASVTNYSQQSISTN